MQYVRGGMNSRVLILNIAVVCGFGCLFAQGNQSQGTLAPWMAQYASSFSPSWDLLPTAQTTYDLFVSYMTIPVDAVTNDSDCSISFDTNSGRVTLFSNGVQRTDKSDGTVEFFEKTSSSRCTVSPSGEVHAVHEDASLNNTYSVVIENGNVICKSSKTFGDGKSRLNWMLRLRDGLSVVFEYCSDGTAIARESSGCVEVITPADLIISKILDSHGMIRPPEGSSPVAEGLVCDDGDGITCYVMNGMKFHAAANGLKFSFSAPLLQAQLEGFASDGQILSRWRFFAPEGRAFKKCCYEGTDILFDAETGRSLLYVNMTTMQSGIFFYDDNGNFCKCSGTGNVRYGKVLPMMMYETVSEALSRSVPMHVVRAIPTGLVARAHSVS